MKNKVRDPEWIRPRQVKEWFGIGQAHVALMIREGRVKSVSLCPPGKATGTRLISFPSLCAYLDQLAAEQQPQAAQEGGAA